jgi:hypothetical protein
MLVVLIAGSFAVSTAEVDSRFEAHDKAHLEAAI